MAQGKKSGVSKAKGNKAKGSKAKRSTAKGSTPSKTNAGFFSISIHILRPPQ